MTEMNAASSVEIEALFDEIAAALDQRGYIVLTDILPAELLHDLHQRALSLAEHGYQRAGIGRQSDLHLDNAYRTDEIHWLERHDAAERAYLDWMEQLRLGLNRRLFLGLFDYECHFAHYAPGAFYKRHLDAFRGNTNRVLTTVCYLNPRWDARDGGQLLMYRDEASDAPFLSLQPQAGTLAVFLSDQFPHEVAPARCDRYSIAGWFRVNNSLGALTDPPR
ncbi:MAG: 2OG-Fe(II) oxygenase [Pseudomonadota bacterium]